MLNKEFGAELNKNGADLFVIDSSESGKYDDMYFDSGRSHK